MPKDLFILRHGHAKDMHPKGDFARELKDQGKRCAQRIGVWLSQNALVPDHISASPAERALTTAHKCCKSAGSPTSIIKEIPSLYNAAPVEILTAIQQAPADAQRVMIVGHNPGLSIIVGHLSEQYISLSPATLVHLQVEEDWANVGKAPLNLVDVIDATMLPKTFPFEGANGIEQRIRPSYYYRQSSVVPYRYTEGKLEILMISSSHHKHWVVPKGIHEPGLSAQDSAAKEAVEEAGITGHVHQDVIGQYAYEKWESTCTVSVYPMEVKQELDAPQWEENHRLRKWVSLESAVHLLKDQELAKIIEDLPAYLEKTTSN
ncbi:NUDIX domain-containing protein [Terasakiella sp. SH-1]|uniref:NUDIX domain-containing protein n=1 Tax=Terasakiella sp. SH-1 TaxID=2560057 RepID=UPI0010749A96|nr:NUDIX domain-containing protein [Terasakiella sp. SH-1]